MQPENTAASEFSQKLTQRAQSIGQITGSLWVVKGVLVHYENQKKSFQLAEKEQKAIDCHAQNIKELFQQLRAECNQACEALCNYNLLLLDHHTDNVRRLHAQLHREAHHFKQVVEKRMARSKL